MDTASNFLLLPEPLYTPPGPQVQEFLQGSGFPVWACTWSPEELVKWPHPHVWVGLGWGPKTAYKVPMKSWEHNLEALLQEKGITGTKVHASLTASNLDNPKVITPS